MAKRPGQSRELTKSGRLFELIRLLGDTRKNLTLYDLSERFGTDIRTIQRDMATLRDMGYSFSETSCVVGRARVRHFAPEAPFCVAPEFTNEELSALYATRQVYAFLKGTHFEKAAESALAKMEPFFGPDMAERLSRAVLVKTGPIRDYSGHHDAIRRLNDAIIFRRVVRIQYFSLRKGTADYFCVHPYLLLFYSNAVYLVAFSEKHQESRTFAVERINHVNETGSGFERSSHLDETDFLNNHFGIHSGPLTTVCIKVFPEHKRRMKDKILHPSQQFTFSRDGTLTITLQMSGKEDLFKWLLSQGDALQLMAPAEWVEEFQQLIGKMTARYARDSAQTKLLTCS
ncbi:MAG: hypothetical protein A2293_05145 [Elusimicrobia bacterium RIFOXYB2_FULL_49_7]|nr:MAG: hypothetical protein A2293_05145 [Elusimicrobia bacterium RIFOXYB2_FULL_49_7]